MSGYSTTAIPRYRKHKATGQAIVTIDGKTFYLGPYGSKRSKAQYDSVIAEWIASGRKLPEPDQRPANSPVTVVEVCAAYLKYATDYYGDPLQTRIKTALKVLRCRNGRDPVERFGPLALRGIQDWLVKQGHSRRYVNDVTAEVKRIFRWAISVEMVAPDIHQRLASVPGLIKGRSKASEGRKIHPVSDEHLEKTLGQLPPIVADMVRMQRLTGMRPAEVCTMRPGNIDRCGDIWLYNPDDHKTNHLDKDRVVAIGPRAQDVLAPYLLRAPKKFCFQPTEVVEQLQRAKRLRRKTKVQPSQQDRSKPNRKLTPGQRYATASYRRAIHRACTKAGVPKWSPNQLRHTAATEIRKEFGVEGAQVALGHSRADVTQVYAERNQELAVEVARRLG